MKRQDKEAVVAEVAEKFSRAKGVYLADFTGLTVEQANELRREFRKSGVDYQVVKNTLIEKALQNAAGFDKMVDKLQGPTAIAFCFGDPISPAKIIRKFIEKHERPAVKLCVVENQVFEGSKLNELAKLPTRQEVIASILGSIQMPVAGVIGAVDAVARSLVNVLHAIEEKKKVST